MILDQIAGKKRERLDIKKRKIDFNTIKSLAKDKVTTKEHNAFIKVIQKKGLSVIGEVKNASPSTGKLNVQLDITQRIKKYEAVVQAISILTEEDYFDGSIEIFNSIRSITSMPLLRKDFIIDPYQIYESKAIGADCILLIAALLETKQLIEYYQLAKSLGLDVLLETHNESEVEKALRTDAAIIGINNRNLKDFTIDLDTTIRLRKYIPNDRLVISESGILSLKDIEVLKQTYIDGVLVGRALMETGQPDITVKEWRELYDSSR